jgi:hypothetical protein
MNELMDQRRETTWAGMRRADVLVMDPLAKWRVYRRFPYKLCLHVLLVALLAAQVRKLPRIA